jgi:hypothetical protein
MTDLDRVVIPNDALPYYPDLITESAARYHNQLSVRLGLFSEQLRPRVERLIELLDRVRDATDIRADDLGFTAQDLAIARAEDVDLLVNQWCLGWGRDSAPIISMGTEEAYPAKPVDLGQWNCCCSVIWATGGRQDVVDALDPRSAHPEQRISGFEQRRQFHIHSNDYYLVHKRHWDSETRRWVRPGRHTWKLLAEVVAGHGHWQPLLEQNVGTLGELTYQIEVSAYPAKLAVAGRASTDERRSFLSTVVGKLRGTAKVLIFHGRANDPGWGGRDTLAGVFLGTPRLTELDWTQLRVMEQPLRYARHGNRLVLLTRALNGNVRTQLIDKLHELVASALSQQSESHRGT